MADTGSGTLVITEEIRERLGLAVKHLQRTTVAGGGKIICQFTEPVTICWQDRSADCNALVMPGEQQVLLGAVPMELMDLTVNPKRQIVEAAHGDEWVFMVK